jgi:hypothetical protein
MVPSHGSQNDMEMIGFKCLDLTTVESFYSCYKFTTMVKSAQIQCCVVGYNASRAHVGRLIKASSPMACKESPRLVSKLLSYPPRHWLPYDGTTCVLAIY